MTDASFIAVFLIGLLGGTHCAGMCGGLVSALSLRFKQSKHNWLAHVSYNMGRILSYTVMGALFGALGSISFLLNHLLPIQQKLYILANLMVIALGLYLTGATRFLAFTEKAGQLIWRPIQPYASRLIAAPLSSPFKIGLLWGFVPCGMVYSVLAAALATGSAIRGGMLMLIFGLGTLPNLLAVGLLGVKIRRLTNYRPLKVCVGILLISFGIYGVLKGIAPPGSLLGTILCVSPTNGSIP